MCDALCVSLQSFSNICHVVLLILQNVSDNSLKRVIQYMRSAKLVEIQQYPVEDLDPSAGPCVYKKGDLNSNLKLSQSKADFKFHFKLSNFFLHLNMHHFPGHKVLVRCLKLLKPYSKKGVTEVYIEEDEDDDEDYTEMGRALPPEGRIMEQDMLSQAYQIGKQNPHSKLMCGVWAEYLDASYCLFNIHRKK